MDRFYVRWPRLVGFRKPPIEGVLASSTESGTGRVPSRQLPEGPPCEEWRGCRMLSPLVDVAASTCVVAHTGLGFQPTQYLPVLVAFRTWNQATF